MKHYRLEAEAAVEFDIESAFNWYETEEPGLGQEFLEQLRLVYRRILENSLGYGEQRYFSVEDETILILAVLHTARDPAEQLRS